MPYESVFLSCSIDVGHEQAVRQVRQKLYTASLEYPLGRVSVDTSSAPELE